VAALNGIRFFLSGARPDSRSEAVPRYGDAMAITLNDLADRDVVAMAEGLQLGRPAQLLLDVDEHRLAYVVVAAGATPDTTVVAPASALSSLEGDSLGLHGLAALELAFRDQAALLLLRRGLGLVGMPVVTDAGEELGTVSDIELDAQGSVINYLVRRSGVGRVLRAHRVPPNEVRSVGQVMTVARPAD